MSNYIKHTLKFENCTFVKRKISDTTYTGKVNYTGSTALAVWLHNLFISRKKKHFYIKYKLLINNQEFVFNSNYSEDSISSLNYRVTKEASFHLVYDANNPAMYVFNI